ncbi:sodium/potassium/calcium exchanger 1-like [Ptychodera flava]|uniref:sodium/potassium/calcium exchanger 1-like n=1 Tax=Ptychodera flava TaxID=63121 RepID=UPI003969DC1B
MTKHILLTLLCGLPYPLRVSLVQKVHRSPMSISQSIPLGSEVEGGGRVSCVALSFCHNEKFIAYVIAVEEEKKDTGSASSGAENGQQVSNGNSANSGDEDQNVEDRDSTEKQEKGGVDGQQDDDVSYDEDYEKASFEEEGESDEGQDEKEEDIEKSDDSEDVDENGGGESQEEQDNTDADDERQEDETMDEGDGDNDDGVEGDGDDNDDDDKGDEEEEEEEKVESESEGISEVKGYRVQRLIEIGCPLKSS